MAYNWPAGTVNQAASFSEADLGMTRAPDPDDSRFTTGVQLEDLWVDATHVYAFVTIWRPGRPSIDDIYAFNRTTKRRDMSRDLDLGLGGAHGNYIWGNESLFYLSDAHTGTVLAFSRSTGTYEPTLSFSDTVTDRDAQVVSMRGHQDHLWFDYSQIDSPDPNVIAHYIGRGRQIIAGGDIPQFGLQVLAEGNLTAAPSAPAPQVLASGELSHITPPPQVLAQGDIPQARDSNLPQILAEGDIPSAVAVGQVIAEGDIPAIAVEQILAEGVISGTEQIIAEGRINPVDTIPARVPRLTNRYKVLVYPDESTVQDWTRFAREITFRYGTRHRNDFGHVAETGSGTITLKNDDGRFHTIEPTPPSRQRPPTFPTTPLPGPRVEIYGAAPGPTTLSLLGTFYSLGFLPIQAPGVRLATMPLEGALGRIRGRDHYVYERFEDDIDVGSLFKQLMENVSWPARLSNVRGESETILHPGRGQIGSGGPTKFADVLSVLDMLASAEAGRIYDNHRAVITFDTFGYRERQGRRWPLTGLITERVVPNQPGSTVVNSIAFQDTDIEVGRLRQIQAFRQPFPMAAFVAAQSEREMVLEVDPTRASFIQRVSPMRVGQHFRLEVARDLTTFVPFQSTTAEIEAHLHPQGVLLRLKNPHVTTLRFVIEGIDGIIGLNRALSPLAYQPIVDQESQAFWGRKHEEYPAAKLFVNRQQLFQRLQGLIARHRGMGAVRPIPQLDVTIDCVRYPQYMTATIGDVMIVGGVQGIDNLNPQIFGIDEVEHVMRPRSHKMTLKLTGGA